MIMQRNDNIEKVTYQVHDEGMRMISSREWEVSAVTNVEMVNMCEEEKEGREKTQRERNGDGLYRRWMEGRGIVISPHGEREERKWKGAGADEGTSFMGITIS
jgi:hypothetical protein